MVIGERTGGHLIPKESRVVVHAFWMRIILGNLLCIPCNPKDHSSFDSFGFTSFHARFRVETAALVREILRRCCAQRAEMVRFDMEKSRPRRDEACGFCGSRWNPGLC